MIHDDDYFIELGSKTAKDGFLNEQFVVDEFNNWKSSYLSRQWLLKMDYKLEDIEYVRAEKVKGSYKADIQVSISISIKLKRLQDIQNIQVKLVSNPTGFNQIDKRWVDKYGEMWNIPTSVLTTLKHFTGELPPYRMNTYDSRRMFFNEFEDAKVREVLDFLNANKTLIVSDILKGRGKFAAEWMLVIIKETTQYKDIKWALEPMNIAMNIFGSGPVSISPQGSIKIGNITMQRKGGDGGRDTANMLQFKINPTLLLKP